jgi:acyl-CoA synthetase (AMP-forming)/AMP-acid ligase II
MSRVPPEELEKMEAWATLVDMCRDRSAADPGRRIFVFLENGIDESAALTLADVDRRSRAIAVRLSELAAPGSRVLLSYPPGLDFVTGFFGALYAGMIAVPVAPIDGDCNDVKRSRIESIARSAEPDVLLTSAAAVDQVKKELADTGRLCGLHVVASDEVPDDAASRWTRPDIGPSTVAYLQYSSGSTGQPKGVVLRHASVLHNLALIVENGSDGGGERPPSFISWLPMFHDMGLISSVVEPIYAGYDAVLMPPVAFVHRPFSWLRAISNVGRANAAAPNFAYEMCARRSRPDQRAQLDLSGWTIALVGAEPVRARTMRLFAETFAPCGFRPETFFPSYGLAESTVMVSGGPVGRGAVMHTFDAQALAAGRVQLAGPGGAGTGGASTGGAGTGGAGTGGGRELVGCGQIQPTLTVVIARPGTDEPCAQDEVGEILVSSRSVGDGYWNQPEETERTFHARVRGYGERDFLRTGDLGFVFGDQLFVTGRLKDVVIIDGHNHYPHDIELTVDASHPAIRDGFCCALSVEEGDAERLVVLAEVSVRKMKSQDTASATGALAASDEVAAAVRRAVTAEHGIAVSDVVLLKLGTLPFTSSGKIQRMECRARYQSGDFDRL